MEGTRSAVGERSTHANEMKAESDKEEEGNCIRSLRETNMQANKDADLLETMTSVRGRRTTVSRL